MRGAPECGLELIDWARGWLAPWRPLGEPLAAQARRQGLVGALNAAAGGAIGLRAGALRFVEQCALPPGESYEAFIARSACVPTRDNLHDFFNGLAWLRYPVLKRRLNELQAGQLAQAAAGAPRGALRDALTLYDENAALLRAPPVLIDALRRRDWTALFGAHRAAWAGAQIELFGHALLEKLVHPRKAITAHVWAVPDTAVDRNATIAAAAWAATLAAPAFSARPFLTLPVLGVPGWWPANELQGFYEDATVFRPAQKNSGPQAAVLLGGIGSEG